MSAYVISSITVTDPVKYENYKALGPAAVAEHGGKFLVRGGEVTVLEGEWEHPRVVVSEFPTIAAAKAFYDSEKYRAARAERAGAARFNMIVVEGV